MHAQLATLFSAVFLKAVAPGAVTGAVGVRSLRWHARDRDLTGDCDLTGDVEVADLGLRPVPRVTVGLPVRNGENFLAETLRASSARPSPTSRSSSPTTPRPTARPTSAGSSRRRDPRIRYLRRGANIGAAANYNAVAEAARGELLHVDGARRPPHPDWIERAVAALEAEPEAPPRSASAGGCGPTASRGPRSRPSPTCSSSDPATRFHAAIRTNPVRLIFGLGRIEALRRVPPHEPYNGSDYGLTGTVVLLGPAWSAGRRRALLLPVAPRRVHQSGGPAALVRPGRHGGVDRPGERVGRLFFPSWRRTGAYVRYALRAPVPPRARLRLVGPLARTDVRDDGGSLAKLLVKDGARGQPPGAGRTTGRRPPGQRAASASNH